MKIALGLTIFTFSTCALALSWDPSTLRDIYDLQYLPNARTAYGQTDLAFTHASSKIKKDSQSLGDASTGSSAWQQTVGYSVLDQLSIQGEIDYLINGTTSFNGNGGAGITNSNSSSKGLGDPKLQARYRLLDERSTGLRLDFVPFYSFKSGDSKDSDSNHQGNNKKGSATYGGKIELGRKFVDFQFMGYLSFERDDEVHTRDPSTNEKQISGARNIYELGAQYQQRLAASWLFNLNAQLGMNGNYKDKTPETGGYTKFPNITTYGVGADAIYSPIKNLAFFASVLFGGASDFSTQNETNSKQKYTDTALSRLVLSARYQF